MLEVREDQSLEVLCLDRLLRARAGTEADVLQASVVARLATFAVGIRPLRHAMAVLAHEEFREEVGESRLTALALVRLGALNRLDLLDALPEFERDNGIMLAVEDLD